MTKYTRGQTIYKIVNEIVTPEEEGGEITYNYSIISVIVDSCGAKRLTVLNDHNNLNRQYMTTTQVSDGTLMFHPTEESAKEELKKMVERLNNKNQSNIVYNII